MSEKKETGEKPPEAFFDGDCPMCRAFVARIDSPAKQLELTDFRKEKLPETITKDEAENKIHFVDSNGTIYRGAAAVFAILRANNQFAFLATLGLLPGIRQIAELVYSVIAANRYLIFGPYQRAYWTKVVLALAFLVPLWITRALWFGESSRFYALTPIASWLPEINWPLDHVIFAAMFGLLIAIALRAQPQRLIIAFCVLTISYSLFDQSRWMPYNYQFVFMFLALAGISWQRTADEQLASEKQRQVLAPLGVVLIGIWFWSGLHKLSARYIFVGYPWMVDPIAQALPETGKQLLYAGAYFSTLVESGGAIALLFRRTRNAAVVVIVGMHCFILLCFGPLGLNFNHSVWSWNLAQIAFCLLIFWHNPKLTTKDFLIPKGLLHALVIVLFLIMPSLNKFGLWDDFLSHALYSWTTTEAEIHLKSPEIKSELPQELLPAIERIDDLEFIHILRWSYLVFESPPYHAHRVFKQVFAKLCHSVSKPQDLELVIFEKPGMLTTKSEKVYIQCRNLRPI